MQFFGLVAEGPTDYAVLENILVGYFNKDISGYINELHPKPGQAGGWQRVLKYCASQDFKNDFTDNDFMIIQVDTDRSHEVNFDVPHTENGEGLTIESLIEKIKERFIGLFESAFGADFIVKYGHRILFAISVHAIECWLLPLYYENTTKALTRGCLHCLNRKWLEIGEPVFGEDRKKKRVYVPNEQRRKPISDSKVGQVPIYDKITKPFMDNTILKMCYPQNPSFKIFIENELQMKVPLENKEE